MAKGKSIRRPITAIWHRLQALIPPGHGWGRSIGRAGEAHTATAVPSGVEEVARLTLGAALWEQLRHQGYLDVRSTQIPGLTYRVRVGRRVQVVWERAQARERAPWRYPYLCINPTSVLPAEVFAAQLVLYLQDREEEVIRVAVAHPSDAEISNVC